MEGPKSASDGEEAPPEPEFEGRVHEEQAIGPLLDDVHIDQLTSVLHYGLRRSEVVLLDNPPRTESGLALGYGLEHGDLGRQQLGLGSTTTVSEYLSYFQQSYLLEFVPKFSWSVKARLTNPKKVYCIDNGILANVSNGFSKNDGHKLENAVFIALRLSGRQVSYYRDPTAECDFITTLKGKPERAIQVCYELNSENMGREIAGLRKAMEDLELDEGFIVTFNQEDHILADAKSITVLPFHEFR